jgi:glucose/arabinose dehydrogenase
MNRAIRSRWVWSAFLLLAAGAVLLVSATDDDPGQPTNAAPARSAQPPPGFTTEAVRGIKDPTGMVAAPDGRLFVTQQTGEIRVVKDGALLADPFVEVTVVPDREQGLLGITLDPGFDSGRPFVYVQYTSPTPVRHNRVSRFTAAGDRAVAGSEITLLDLPPLDSTQHVGGGIHFGPDGMLYVAVGENDHPERAQALDNPFGKILRVRFDGTAPADNPFVDGDGPNWDAIWATGFRNPFSFSWSAATGRLFVADVGEDAWEEIDDVTRGGNYGWPVREGPCARGSSTDCAAARGFAQPLFAYEHPDGCAVTGADVYEPPSSAAHPFPSEYLGDVFFADLCTGALRRLDAPDHTSAVDFIAAEDGISIVDVATAPDGSLWYLSIGLNAAVRVAWAG